MQRPWRTTFAPILISFSRSYGTDFLVDVTIDTSRICGVARHGFWVAHVTDMWRARQGYRISRVTDFGWRRLRILDAEVADSGVADLQG